MRVDGDHVVRVTTKAGASSDWQTQNIWTKSLDEAAKLALLSFDATIRSNLSVGMPLDLLRYATDSYKADNLITVDDDTPYWQGLRAGYSEGLARLVAELPAPPPCTAA